MTRQPFAQQQKSSTPTRPRTRPDAGLMKVYRADLDAVRADLAAPLPPLQREWGKWVRDFSWDWFGTFTFPSAIHPEQADKRWTRWVWAIQRSGGRTTRDPVVWVRGAERQERGVFHYHALLGRVAGVGLFGAVRLWEGLAGGWAKIEPYNNARARQNHVNSTMTAAAKAIEGTLTLFFSPRELEQAP